MTDYDVIICGLGPVGQLLALLLGDRGVRTLAFDRDPEPYLLPRAAVIDDEVLRILQSVGLDEAVLTDAQMQAARASSRPRGAPSRSSPHPHRPAWPSAAGLDQPAGDGAHDARRARGQAERRDTPGAHARGARPPGRPRRRLRAAQRRRALGAHLRPLAGRLRRRRQRGPGPPADPARGPDHPPAAASRRRGSGARARRCPAAPPARPRGRRRASRPGWRRRARRRRIPGRRTAASGAPRRPPAARGRGASGRPCACGTCRRRRARSRRVSPSSHGSIVRRTAAGSRSGAASSPGCSIHSQRWRPGDIGSVTIGRAASPTKCGCGTLRSGRSTSASTTTQRCGYVRPSNGISQAGADGAGGAVAADQPARGDALGAPSAGGPHEGVDAVGPAIERLERQPRGGPRRSAAARARRAACAPSPAG